MTIRTLGGIAAWFFLGVCLVAALMLMVATCPP